MPLSMSEIQSVTNAMYEEFRKATKRRGQMFDEFSKLTEHNKSYATYKLRSSKCKSRDSRRFTDNMVGRQSCGLNRNLSLEKAVTRD